MKTRNFPARRNARRVGAFSRLPKTLTITDDMSDEQKRRAKAVEVEAHSLAQSILTDSVARSTRTKKLRAGRRIV